MHTHLTITGMTCSHCQHAVEHALKAVPGVTEATVDLERGAADVTGDAPFETLAAAVYEAGYTAEPGNA